jgi:hypothetical protein
MAGRSQYVIEIMATQTRLDLNAALENWRKELAAQPQLTPDDRRELEKHLADSMAELRGRGLNEEESFWLAQRRIGQPQQLAEEFHKVDVVNVWRERIFWFWLAFFSCPMLEGLFNAVAMVSINWGFHGMTQMTIYYTELFVLTILVPSVMVVLLAKGKLIPQFSLLMPLIQGRWRLAIATFVLILLSVGIRVATLTIYFHHTTMGSELRRSLWTGNLVPQTLYTIILGLVLVWLYPMQSPQQRMEKPA